ncbi:MAG: secondary thiamine-phosphate synthase enzyme YjbQ [Myxococcaceae bacterium]|nr:secondary thiamine-phosphate synthase enzyme YjbQ [Myxococcaceae bacterium]
MHVASEQLAVRTRGRGFTDLTGSVRRFLERERCGDGLLTCFVRHTSASLLVQENADPSVREDLERFLGELVPDGDPRFSHDAEGPDDMPAHVRAALTQTSVGIPVARGQSALGTWQALYLYEHRHQGHDRSVVLQFVGTRA